MVHRLIAAHLDLKGVMFRPSYIPRLLADLAGQGINAVVVEYEDIFPFEGINIACDKSVVWSRKTLRRFLDEARRNRIEVIPLQQCLGHFEYIFRWNRYRHFALDRAYPSTLDIDNPKARAFLFEMLRQVLEAHLASRYIHVGMDEAHALVTYCKKHGKDVVEVFLNHLAGICDLCERYGKTPMIWSDMLEDHMNARSLKLFAQFKDRVILCPWDYASAGDRIGIGRIAGFRASRQWLNGPDDPSAPTLTPGNTWIEDMPAVVRKLTKPYLRGRFFMPMFQADLWSRLGFRVLGATSTRAGEDVAVLPHYCARLANIRAWACAVKRTRTMGVIATSWARGTSWCPPIFNIDLQWPLIGDCARLLGAKSRPFFTGIPQNKARRLILTLGRSRADWRLESQVADEMEQLAPRLKSHRYEWQSIVLMARVLALHRRAEYAQSEVDFFHANIRPVDTEWQRRLDDQAGILKELAALRRQVRAHFRKRYHGDAFAEWIRDLFDLHAQRLRDCRRVCRRKRAQARAFYAA